MTLSDREKFLISNVVMITSRWAKKFPRPIRASLLTFIRDKHSPTVTNEDWSELAKDINEHISATRKSFLTGFYDAMKNPFKIQGDPSLTKLDKEIRENMNDIDLEDIDMDEMDSETRKLLGQVKSLKRDYENHDR